MVIVRIIKLTLRISVFFFTLIVRVDFFLSSHPKKGTKDTKFKGVIEG